MKMDFKRSHGIVIGHDSAKYEQDGKLFNSSGELIEDEPAATRRRPGRPPKAQIRPFLESMLGSDPMAKSAIYKASQEKGLQWDEVTNAFLEMGGKKTDRFGEECWQIGEVENSESFIEPAESFDVEQPL